MVNYPYQQATLLNSDCYIELNNQGQTLRFELKRQQHILGRDRSVADLVVPETWQVMGRTQATIRKEGENYRIYDGNGQTPSTNGLYVNQTRITPDSGFLLKNGTTIHIGLNPQSLIVLKYVNPNQPIVGGKISQGAISLKQGSVLLGRDPNASLFLDSPNVSRRHATIDADGRGRYILKDYSVAML